MFKDDVDDNGVILDAVKNMILDIENNLSKGTTSGFTAAYEKFDLPSMVDQLLIYEMTMNAEFRHPKSLYTYIDHTKGSPKYGKLCVGPVWDFDFETFPTLGQTWVELNERDYEKSVMATKNLVNHKTANSVPNITGPNPEALKGDAPFMWYPLLIKDQTFTAMAKERWETINTSLKQDIEREIDNMGTYLALSWDYNDEMWPIQHGKYSTCGTRDFQTRSGFCGDEELETFGDVIKAFKTAFTNRYNGMNKFVSAGQWQ
jgi:hypothetical protein